MGNRMQGKVVFITGGSDGIGRATAIRLAEEGAKVIICARRKENLAEAEAAVKAVGAMSRRCSWMSAIPRLTPRRSRMPSPAMADWTGW